METTELLIVSGLRQPARAFTQHAETMKKTKLLLAVPGLRQFTGALFDYLKEIGMFYKV